MATVAELQARLEKLRQVRAYGHREVEWDGRRIRYASDAELAAAIVDLEQQLAAASGSRVHTVRFSTSKGLDR